MSLSQPQPLPDPTPPSVRNHNRALTLVFGSDGQVSLLGFDSAVALAPTAIPVIIASDSGRFTLPPMSSLSTSPIPYRAATSGIVSNASPLTSAAASSSTASKIDSAPINATGTDTSLPSIPTVNYPTPEPTTGSNPSDHGVGAPFYLAIVLASIAFIGCVSAVIAWWIRSRNRRRTLELDDPWINRSDLGFDSPIIIAHTDPNVEAKVDKWATQASTSPYYLPESIVRRGSSSNLLPFPPQSAAPTDDHTQGGLDTGPYPSRLQNPYSQRNVRFSQATNANPRPGAERMDTGLSVQESTRTLGRLHVTNRVPGDVTSGDEGVTNRSRLLDRFRSSPTSMNADQQRATDHTLRNMGMSHCDRHPQDDDIDMPLDPPGPATISWGRRMSGIPALRRTRRPLEHDGPTSNGSLAHHLPPIPPSNTQGWADTFKLTFWNTVGSVAGNRPSDSDLQPGSGESNSRFTPAPQRVASRRSSPTSPSRPEGLGTIPFPSRENSSIVAEATTFTGTGVIHESPSSLPNEYFSRPNSGAPSTVPTTTQPPLIIAKPLPAKISNLNRPPGSTRRLSDSLRTETGSIYSTDSSAARANLRKYGYADSIVSSRSALHPSSAVRLDQPTRTSTPSSLTPSRLMAELNLPSEPLSDLSLLRSKTGSDDTSVRYGSTASISGGTAAGSLYTVSRSTTQQSGRSTMRTGRTAASSVTSSMYNLSRNGKRRSGHSGLSSGNSSLQLSSATPTTLSRKKGVIRRRPVPLQRVSSTASSIQTTMSGQSNGDVAVRKALLERRRKVGASASHAGRGESSRTHDSTSFLV